MSFRIGSTVIVTGRSVRPWRARVLDRDCGEGGRYLCVLPLEPGRCWSKTPLEVLADRCEPLARVVSPEAN